MKLANRTGLALLALLLPAAALAQPAVVDLSGPWGLQATGNLSAGAAPCSFQGAADLVQTGSQISGVAFLNLLSGPDGCPAEMTADVSGVIQGLDFTATLDGGALGVLDTSGQAAQDGSSAQGSYLVTQGPFQNVTGDWSLTQASTFAIPTLGGIGLAALIGLLAAAGFLALRPRTG